MNVREWALPVYTVLMQMAVGGLLVLWVIRAMLASRFDRNDLNHMMQNIILVINLTCLLAMVASHFHLSKPFHSFMAILNIETSWLSREILFTILFFLCTVGLWYAARYKSRQQGFITGIGWLAVLFGLAAVYCMASIYMLPTQTVWNSSVMIVSFYVTTILLGSVMVVCLMVLDMEFAGIQKSQDLELHTRLIQYSIKNLAFIILGLVMAGTVITAFQVFSLSQGDATARYSLSLLLGIYMPLFILRIILLFYASLSLCYYVMRVYRMNRSLQSIVTPVYLSSLMIIIAEVMGRFLFYAIHVRIGI